MSISGLVCCALQSGARINISDASCPERIVTISGTTPQIVDAFAMISRRFEEVTHTHTHNTHPFNGRLSGTTRVSRYQKGKTNLDFTGARDSEWQWNPLGHMQVCISHQTDNHASTPPLRFLQAGCPSCRPTYSVKALKAMI